MLIATAGEPIQTRAESLAGITPGDYDQPARPRLTNHDGRSYVATNS